MLKPEQAQKMLEEQRVKDVEQYQLVAIAGLPEQVRSIAYGLLQRDTEGQQIKQDYQRQRDVYQQAFARLPTLDAAERLRIFAVFFPQLAPAIELAWQRLSKLPYQVGYSALLFRAPQRPDLLAPRQQSWLGPLLGSLGAYHQDIIWFAHYAAYINNGYLGEALGVLFAAVIDDDPVNGDAIFAILVDSAKGEDEIGTMGRHISQALLGAARPGGWQFIGKLLLAAQRQDGLRQIVLEGLDDAHPQAFRYLLRLIVENDLSRISAVTLMLNSWLGCQWDSAQKAAITRMLQRLLTLLEDVQAREAALAAGSGEEVYLALWAIALDDVLIAIERAAALVQDAAVERRFAAVHLLAETALPDAAPALMAALGDADLRVLARACQGLESIPDDRTVDLRLPIFEQVEVLLPRLSAHAPLAHAPASTPIIWEWLTPSLERERVANLLIKYLGDRDPRQLLPYLSLFGQYHRVQIAGLLAEKGNRDPEIRAALLLLLRDRSAWVSDAIVKLLDKHGLEVAEIPQLEALLTRKSAGLRRGLLDLLIKQTDDVVLAAADRLTYAHNDQQRLAGLELLRVLHEHQRSSQDCMERAAAYRESRKQLSPSETILLDPILDASHEKPTLANALGLANPAECAQVAAPLAHPVQLHQARAMTNLKALDALVHEHRNQSYSADTWQG
ncbi:MAG TPA: HEAT repeat domain-containing protein, partial [Ktedonobacterales bacterium]